MSDLGTNELVRARSLWLLADELGWHLDVYGPCTGGIWPPLAGTDFAACCREGSPSVAEAASADVMVAVKPTRTALGRALRLGSATGTRVVLDVDEPPLDRLVSPRVTTLVERVSGVVSRRYHPAEVARVRLAARSLPRTVSNPALQRNADDRVIPHVQRPLPPGRQHHGSRLSVGFVGTARAFKGIAGLRDAVRCTQGAKLVVTDWPPDDASQHERWLGELSMQEAQAVLDELDVAVIPSDATPFSAGQLPMKLIDAMRAGRAVVASDLPPIRWALGDAGLLVEPGDSDALAAALRSLIDPDVRRDLGERARRRALASFTPEVVAPRWATLLEDVIATGGTRS